MAHECFLCGSKCWCDGDDIEMPQPSNCTHVCDDDDEVDEFSGPAVPTEEEK